jgi:hypothetical protein
MRTARAFQQATPPGSLSRPRLAKFGAHLAEQDNGTLDELVFRL